MLIASIQQSPSVAPEPSSDFNASILSAFNRNPFATPSIDSRSPLHSPKAPSETSSIYIAYSPVPSTTLNPSLTSFPFLRRTHSIGGDDDELNVSPSGYQTCVQRSSTDFVPFPGLSNSADVKAFTLQRKIRMERTSTPTNLLLISEEAGASEPMGMKGMESCIGTSCEELVGSKGSKDRLDGQAKRKTVFTLPTG